jgi:hypothetical protein
MDPRLVAGDDDDPSTSQLTRRGRPGDEILGDDVLGSRPALSPPRARMKPRDLMSPAVPFAAVERLDPADVEDVRADPVDLGAESDQESEVLTWGCSPR